MEVIRKEKDFKRPFKNPVLTIGNFDGVHLGHQQIFRPVLEATLREEIRKEPGRRHYVRGIVSFREGQYMVSTTGAQGSNILNSMMRANGLIVIPEGQDRVRPGEKVSVQLLSSVFGGI